jgi:hypothetical protein
MRRYLLIPAMVIALAVVMPAGAAGQAPDFKDRFTEDFVDDDFCGTGFTVTGTEDTVAQGYDDGTTFRLMLRQRITFTYEGKTVTLQNAGRILAQSLDAPFDEPHTEIIKETGLRAKLLIPGQGAVTLDHGNIVYSITFVPNTDPESEDPLMVSDIEVLKDAGGHPDFYAPVFCEAATSYFGIPFEPEE